MWQPVGFFHFPLPMALSGYFQYRYVKSKGIVLRLLYTSMITEIILYCQFHLTSDGLQTVSLKVHCLAKQLTVFVLKNMVNESL